MKQEKRLDHRFVEFIPDELQEGILYVSMRFATVSHLCACGCNTKVVTPLKPTDWKLMFDGKTVSLFPSIGNWSFPCRSHYWVRNNKVQWAEDWSQERISAGRDYDHRARERYFGEVAESDGRNSVSKEEPPAQMPAKVSWWKRLWSW